MPEGEVDQEMEDISRLQLPDSKRMDVGTKQTTAAKAEPLDTESETGREDGAAVVFGRYVRSSEGFGFVSCTGGSAVFMMPSACADFGHMLPPIGTDIAFSVVNDDKTGRARADNVRSLATYLAELDEPQSKSSAFSLTKPQECMFPGRALAQCSRAFRRTATGQRPLDGCEAAPAASGLGSPTRRRLRFTRRRTHARDDRGLGGDSAACSRRFGFGEAGISKATTAMARYLASRPAGLPFTGGVAVGDLQRLRGGRRNLSGSDMWMAARTHAWRRGGSQRFVLDAVAGTITGTDNRGHRRRHRRPAS